MSPELKVLMRKEWKQLTRSRMALLTGLLMPFLFLIVVPGMQMIAAKTAPSMGMQPPAEIAHRLPPGMQGVPLGPTTSLFFIMPLMVTLCGLMGPSMAATYTVISERETRTLELLMALPIRVEQMLWAKMLVLVQLSLATTGVLFIVDAVLLLALGLAPLTWVLALALALVAALAYSTAAALLISLVGKDYRTANNINGMLFIPTMTLTLVALLLIPGQVFHLLVLAGALLACAGVALFIALKVVTFERLMR